MRRTGRADGPGEGKRAFFAVQSVYRERRIVRRPAALTKKRADTG